MATRLKNILVFTDVAPGATTQLAHGLNVNGRAVVPDTVSPGRFGASFDLSADAINVTATNNDSIPHTINVLVEHWHTIERAFGDTSITDLSPQPIILNPAADILGTAQQGNTVIVDEIYGDDAMGAREEFPFATIPAALAAALPGDIVFLRPGTYDVPGGITIPEGVDLRGASANACTIRALDVVADTTLVTMGVDSRLEDVSLLLTTATASVDLVALRFPGLTEATARVRTVVITVTSSGLGGTGDAIGVLSDGTGVVGTVENIRGMSILVVSDDGGAIRGVLVNGANSLAVTDATITLLGVGPGSYIGIETDDPGAEFLGQVLIIDAGTGADISQTQGTLRLGGATQLSNVNANGLGFGVLYHPNTMVWADPGGLPGAATRYLRPGTAAVASSPIFVRVPQAAVVKGISVRMTTASGVGASTTFTVQRNGVDTAVAVTLADATVSAQNSAVSIGFAVGDDMSVKVVTAGGSSAQDVVCVVELF